MYVVQLKVVHLSLSGDILLKLTHLNFPHDFNRPNVPPTAVCTSVCLICFLSNYSAGETWESSVLIQSSILILTLAGVMALFSGADPWNNSWILQRPPWSGTFWDTSMRMYWPNWPPQPTDTHLTTFLKLTSEWSQSTALLSALYLPVWSIYCQL